MSECELFWVGETLFWVVRGEWGKWGIILGGGGGGGLFLGGGGWKGGSGGWVGVCALFDNARNIPLFTTSKGCFQ